MVTPMKQQYKDAMSEMASQAPSKDNSFTKHFLPAERDVVILWGIYRGWSAVAIAHKINKSADTVRRVIASFNTVPALLFRLPVLHLSYKGQKRMFTCAFCGREMMNVREKAAREHVASHLFTERMIKEGGVFLS